ncbi:hypothetical protein [Actinacidiphila acididurans]|nr:hypothetical protein [Actinacidiphila acididurans]
MPWASFHDNALLRVRLHYAPPRAGAIGTSGWSAPVYFTLKPR